ncbi:MAG: CocE/NonD family hydrolase [Proteobacteria bacterium]|nr:CocE/NonD family hydrolase [Pseudomonadota bacterium]
MTFRNKCFGAVFTILFATQGCADIKGFFSSLHEQKQEKQEDAVSEDARFIVENYDKNEYRIAMRDGIKLFTAVYSPKDMSRQYPILLLRTPYSLKPYGEDKYRDKKLGSTMLMTREKFIFAYQDVRGRFMSEGEFVNMRPIVADKESNKETDESTDAYDTIDWLVKNVQNNNDKVGMWGISYPGFYAASALVNSHPALVAVSPQGPIANWFFDDFHHHGTFFPVMALSFFYSFGRPRDGLTKEWPKKFEFGVDDGYNFFLEKIGPLNNVNEKYLNKEIPFWSEIIAHPNYDNFWQQRNLLPHLKNAKPAVMTVGGWYDAEDLYGTFSTYQSIEKNSPGAENIFVIGPWKHGAWARTDGTTLGNVFFGDDPAPSKFYLENIELPFFLHYLKDAKNPNLPEAYAFETGTNKWRQLDMWPPSNVEHKKLYFSAKNALSFDVPAEDKAFDEFISDPQKPVPFTETITTKMIAEYMTDDQRFSARRPDVLVYKTAVLKEPVTLAGKIAVNLEVSTTRTDADWMVKLIDVYPDDHPAFKHNPEHIKLGGCQQMVRSEAFRGRFRSSYENPKPFVPNRIETVQFDLLDVLHTFKKGHRIMIHVQSTWFPLVDRNPQKYVDNIFEAEETDFVKATHRVYRSKENSSHIVIGVASLSSPNKVIP